MGQLRSTPQTHLMGTAPVPRETACQGTGVPDREPETQGCGAQFVLRCTKMGVE
jgi:hypothetical protein